MARPLKYDSEKKERKLRVTESGWEGTRSIALSLNRSGIADLLEDLARGTLIIGEVKPSNVEQVIADILRTIPPNDRRSAKKWLTRLAKKLQ
jgi:hypothetical protein